MSRLNEKERIRRMFGQMASIRQTAKQTGHSHKTIRRALGCNKINAPQTRPRKSKLDPYKAKIGYLVKEKNLSGVRVLEEVRQLGYTGGYSILKDHIRKIRPKEWLVAFPISRDARHSWA